MSTIRGVIARVISKSDERVARGRFEITTTITPLIVSITNFSSWLVLRGPICHIIDARSRGCPITGVRFELFVIGYPRDFHVNYARYNGFFSNVFYNFQNLGKALQTFSLKRSFQKTFLIPKKVIDIISIGPCRSYNSGINRARNFKSASRFAFVQFWNYSRDYSLNCTPLGPITITNRRSENQSQSRIVL